MSNIVLFAEHWHNRNPEGVLAQANRAWRYLNIMRQKDLQQFAQALHLQSPQTSYFMSKMEVGNIHSMEMANAIGYSRSEMRACIKIARELKMIRNVDEDIRGSIIKLTPYGWTIRNELQNGLFTKTG
jgi:DNA-binding MarR family transcriptional regulator